MKFFENLKLIFFLFIVVLLENLFFFVYHMRLRLNNFVNLDQVRDVG
jgi:hypothetical protein